MAVGAPCCPVCTAAATGGWSFVSFGGRSTAVCHVGRMWIGLRVSEIVYRIVMCVVVPVLVDRG